MEHMYVYYWITGTLTGLGCILGVLLASVCLALDHL